MSTKKDDSKIKFELSYENIVYLREKNIDLNEIINYIVEDKEIFEESFVEKTFLLRIDDEDDLFFNVKRSKNDDVQIFTITDIDLMPIMWVVKGVKRGDYYYIKQTNIKDANNKQIPLGEYIIDPYENHPRLVILRPSLANPSKERYAFPKSTFDDHFDIAKPRSINISDQSYSYLLTDSEYECLQIFIKLMNNTDLKELKEKLFKIK